jgi:hypothetical protein
MLFIYGFFIDVTGSLVYIAPNGGVVNEQEIGEGRVRSRPGPISSSIRGSAWRD